MSLVPLFLALLVLAGTGSEALAASQKALSLRQASTLVAFTPPEAFLTGNFVADETNPQFIFGTVKDFVASRKYPTTWLIEEGEKKRLAASDSPGKPMEYSVYLEEDCPGQVVYYVFVDQSRMGPKQWIEWRRQVYKVRAEGEFGAAQAKLDKACADGCGVSGELRFISKDGELLGKSPEEYLRLGLKFPAIYDLNQQKKISK